MPIQPTPYRKVTRLRLTNAMEHGVWGGMIVNLVLIPLFWSAGIHWLALFSVGSALLYAACLRLIRRHVDVVVFLTFLEIIVHVPVVVVALGWQGGFQYYLLVLVPLIFVASPRNAKVTSCLAILLAACFIVLDYYTQRFAPKMDIDEGVLTYIRYGNILAAFGLSSYIAWRYGRILLRAERDLTVAANTDPLSGLSNRRHMVELISREMARSDRSGLPLSFVLADIDDFKAINDRYGHELGDEVILVVSRTLADSVRVPDLVARWGGEEFLLALPETAIDSAAAVAERIRQAVAGSPLKKGNTDLTVTMTFGVSQWRPGESLETCLERADQALYEGKEQGKNRVQTR